MEGGKGIKRGKWAMKMERDKPRPLAVAGRAR